jgi:hypothetical protein
MKITCVSHVKISVKTMGNARQIIHYTIAKVG